MSYGGVLTSSWFCSCSVAVSFMYSCFIWVLLPWFALVLSSWGCTSWGIFCVAPFPLLPETYIACIGGSVIPPKCSTDIAFIASCSIWEVKVLYIYSVFVFVTLLLQVWSTRHCTCSLSWTIWIFTSVDPLLTPVFQQYFGKL